MKTWIGAVAVLLAAGGAWTAQDQSPKASVILPPPGQPELLFVANRGSGNDVTVWNNYTSPSGSNLVKQIQDPKLIAPYGILADPARRALYVTNNGASPGSITVISGDTLTVTDTIVVTDSQALKGIVMSDDGNSLFVAGRSISQNTAAVFQVDILGKTSSMVAFDGSPGDAAEDCAVIPSSVAGGTGSGPGRVYFSVPGGVAGDPNGFIGIHYFVGSGAARFNMLSTPDNTNNVHTPTRMSRSPDGTVVFSACTANTTMLPLVRIDASANTSSQRTVIAGATGPWFSNDVSFRPEATNRAYVIGNRGLGTIDLYEVDSTGAGLPIGSTTVTPLSGVVTNALTLRHHLDPQGNDLVLTGPPTATGADVYFGVYDVSKTPASQGTFIADGAGSPGVGEGPTYFAFLAMPLGPVLDRTLPKGLATPPGTAITVKGANFQPGAVVQLGSGAGVTPVTTTFVDSTTLTASVGSTGGTLYDVIVLNPDGQSATLKSFFASIVPPGSTPGFSIPLPPLATGYEIHSFPQYGTIQDLQAAFAAQLGPYDPVSYRVFFWNVDHYDELNTLSNAVDPDDLSGRAFFVLTRDGGSLSLSTPDVTANTPGGVRVIPLSPGWNLFSQPLLRGANSIAWASVQVAQTSDLANPISASGAPFLSPLPYDYVNNAYVNVNTLFAAHGYWVHNYNATTVWLIINLTNVTTAGGAASVAATITPLAAGDSGPPPPPGAGAMGASSGSSGGGCGLLGPELLLLALGRFAFQRLRDRRKLRA